ncbi:MAG: type IX secretion system protein PorG [Lutibacter sp.]
MKKIYILILISCIPSFINAQINEVGIMIGGSNYIGDIGSEYYINPNNFMGGLIYKRNLNPRITLRGTFTYAQLSANDNKSTNSARQNRGLRFTNTIKELAAGVEFNFFEYNLDDYALTQTPYILVEISAFNYSVAKREISPDVYEYGSKTAFSIPFGLGYKTKFFRALALAFEIRARYTFNDDLDFNNQNIPSLNYGNPNSNDWYLFSGITLTYTFGRPPCYASPK